MALIPEDRQGQGLVLGRSIQENLILASLERVSTLGVVKRRRVAELATRWLSATDVRAPSAASMVGDLSGGNQQKVLIAKWLLRQPQLLIADEPTRGVDVAAKVAIHRLLAQAAAEGRGVVLISSELDELLGLAHRILVFRQGTVVAELTGPDMTPNRVMSAAFGAATRTDDEAV
jgi:ABC-type sugar transport system ATPase subunit